MFRSAAFLNREEGLQGQHQRNQRVDVVHSTYKTKQADLAIVLPSFMLEAPYSNIITGGNNYFGRRFQICFLKCRNTCVSELGRLEASGDRYKRSAG